MCASLPHFLHARAHTHTHTHTQANTHTYTHTYTQTHTDTHTDTHTHAYTLPSTLQLPKPSVFKMWQILMDLWNDSAKRHGVLKVLFCELGMMMAFLGSECAGPDENCGEAVVIDTAHCCGVLKASMFINVLDLSCLRQCVDIQESAILPISSIARVHEMTNLIYFCPYIQCTHASMHTTVTT